MERATARIEGTDRAVLVEALKEKLGDYFIYTYGDVIVLFIERYYFRINSNLMTAVMLSFSEPKKCTVELNTGGGGEGLLGISWGAEDSSNGKILRFLESLSEEKGWRFTIVTDETENS